VLHVIVSVIVIFKTIFPSHCFSCVTSSDLIEERLRIIEEVEKIPREKTIDVAKRLGLPPSPQNSIIAKKREIREHAFKCGTSDGQGVDYSKVESALFAWYQQDRASGIPVDGTILWKKSRKIAATMGIENVSA
jgi:hypothetical protein